MYQPLAPCPGCSRHIKTSERTCPFCKSAMPESMADAAVPGATPGTRLTRAAAFAFTASLAVVAAAAGAEGCTAGTVATGGDASSREGGGPNDEGGQQPIYGAPAYGGFPVDSGPDDAGGGGAKYGGPPIDSGRD